MAIYIYILSASLLLFVAGQAALARGKFYSEVNPGKCTYETLVLSPGESAKAPEACALVTCDSDDGWLTIETCISIAPPPQCEWTDFVDINAPYPACCARHYNCLADCPNNQTLVEARVYQENVHNMLGASVAALVNPEVPLAKHNS